MIPELVVTFSDKGTRQAWREVDWCKTGQECSF